MSCCSLDHFQNSSPGQFSITQYYSISIWPIRLKQVLLMEFNKSVRGMLCMFIHI